VCFSSLFNTLAMMRFLSVFLAVADGYVYDLFMPHYKSNCTDGCQSWASVKGAEKYFAGGKVPAEAGSHCVIASATADRSHDVDHSYEGSWCFCGDGTPKYCSPPENTVEQLNLQIARHDAVVAGFVTYEDLPSSPAIAMLGTSPSSMVEVKGTSVVFTEGSRNYIMHYVPFRDLEPHKTYYYKVKSGSSKCAWTDVVSFRAPYLSGTTKLAVYGDMGHTTNNNMGNMKDDCEKGDIDAIFHMGDHAYNFEGDANRRGDAYMNIFQPLLQSCPWMPIIGNHEYFGTDDGARFQKMADGIIIGDDGVGFESMAHSRLHQHLAMGTLLGAGLQGATPSNTSRYTSTDIGLVHVIGIETQHWDDKQHDWMEKDLKAANANRDKVPWILVMNHFPTYFTHLATDSQASRDAYVSDAGEFNSTIRYQTCHSTTDPSKCQTLAQWQAMITNQLEPLLLEYKVDVMAAGHNHRYESTWPMKGGRECSKSLDNPSCPVYVVEGNGGMPGGCAETGAIVDCSCLTTWCRKYDTKQTGGYGRVTVTESSLRWDHVENSNGAITDTWTINKGSGPFPPSPSPPPSPPAHNAGDTLKRGGTLNGCVPMESANATAYFGFPDLDGNLVLRDSTGKALWASNSTGHPGSMVTFQKSDGNLVLYDYTHKSLWSSGPHKGAETVVLQDDCDLVKKDNNGKILWSLGTSCKGSPNQNDAIVV